MIRFNAAVARRALSASAKGAATAGKPIRCRAAVAWKAGSPLSVEEVDVAPPEANEVRVRMVAAACCHTDLFTLSGEDPEGVFPAILGHEGSAVVESVGENVTSVAPGDNVIPLYTPECGECTFCTSGKTNLCQKIRATQGKGLLPDGTTRFTAAKDGTPIYSYMGTSTFSEYSVLADISVAKVRPDVPPAVAAAFGCGATTGIGAARISSPVQPGETVAVFGLGAVGLSVIQAANLAGASRIIGIDLNEGKFKIARKFGATDLVNPSDHDGNDTLTEAIVEMTGGGVDRSYVCIGSTAVMRVGLEVCHKGWGTSCIIGVAGAGQEISTRPFQLVTGRNWCGSAFGGVKGRSQLPGLVDEYMDGKLRIDDLLTHELPLDRINEAFDMMHDPASGSIRTTITF